VLLAAGLGLVAAPRQARAVEGPRDAVRAVLAGVQRVHDEVKSAEPWPGAKRWVPQLEALGRQLDRSGAGDARTLSWYGRTTEGFGERNRADALRVLDQLQRRLALLDETLAQTTGGQRGEDGLRLSREDVKERLRREASAPERKRAAAEEKAPEADEGPKRLERKHEGGEEGGGRPRAASGSTSPAAPGGFGPVAWMALAGVALGVVAVAAALFLTSRRSAPAAAPKPAAPAAAEEVGPPLYEQPAAVLWEQAEGLAREGLFREAVRLLYLAALAALHQRHLVRCEPTRTNGEYVRQVRLAPEAPPGLHAPFEELTALFERKWYGDGACDAAEYAECRRLAEDVRGRVGKV